MLLLWDASALVKRYALEVGSEAVDALLLEVPIAQMVTSFIGYAETYAADTPALLASLRRAP